MRFLRAHGAGTAHELEDIVKVIERIKARARVLHRRAAEGDAASIERFRTLPSFRC